MPIIRMQAPEGLTSFSHEGHAVEIENGVVQIDHRHRLDFIPHGFTVIPTQAAAQKVYEADPRREESLRPFAPPAQAREISPAALAFLDKLTGASESTLARLSALLNEPEPTSDLATLADPAVIHAADPRPAVEPAPVSTEGILTDEQIMQMTPAQMKAWLKARDVPMEGVGSDRDVLRAKVIHHNQG